MSITIRAVVENGTLRPLDPIDLVEGAELEVIINDGSYAAPSMDTQLSLFASSDDE
jgi:predicted DNA-binding antitoxin AbrB/MazE fold protein